MSYEEKDGNFRSASEKWDLVDALMGGTDTMRGAGEEYLPKYSLENNELYSMRLKTSTLFNAYKKAVETNVGKITARKIQVEGGSTMLQDFIGNVDSTGRSLHDFSKDLLRNAINHGVSFILVDYPKSDQPLTLADVNRAKPYFVDINAQQLLSIKSKMYNGVEELCYFKYQTTSTPDFIGWDSVDDEQIVQIREYMKNYDTGTIEYRVKENREGGWVTSEEGIMEGLDFIPVIPLYGNRTSFFLGEPLLNDLAELNIRHWQSSSDQQWVLHFARSPVMFGTGIDNRDENGLPQQINVGPNSVVLTDRTDADLKYVEHSGSAIGAGREDLKDIEDQMAVMGLDISVDRTGNMTATGRAIDAASADSILKSVAVQLEEALTTALLLVEVFYGSTTPFTVDVNKEYIPVFDQKEMGDIWEMYREGLITAGDLLREAKRRNLITPQYQIEGNLDEQTYQAQGDE